LLFQRIAGQVNGPAGLSSGFILNWWNVTFIINLWMFFQVVISILLGIKLDLIPSFTIIFNDLFSDCDYILFIIISMNLMVYKLLRVWMVVLKFFQDSSIFHTKINYKINRMTE